MRTESRPHVFLTGATGQVGGAVLGELLAAGHRVTCLARPKGEYAAEARVRATLERLGYPSAGAFDVVEGDLRQPGLGIDASRRPQLARAVTHVIHSAALVVFEGLDNGEPFITNVEGCARVIDFAESAGAHLTHISTAYVSGDREQSVGEAISDEPPRFKNAYEQSKWQAEQQVWAAGERGLPVLIARPSIIVGDAAEGRVVHFQGFYLLCRAVSKLCVLLRHDPREGKVLALPDFELPGELSHPINLVPSDYVARSVAHLALLDEAYGAVYHLTHPEPPTMRHLYDALSRFYGLCLPGLFNDAPQAAPSPEQQRRFNRVSRAFWRLAEPLKPYFTVTPEFETGHARALLEPAGIRPEPINAALLQRLIGYAERADFA